MSQDRLTALRLLSYLTIVMPPTNTLALNVVYSNGPSSPSSSSSIHSSAFYQSSRKFGGYRIVPRACKDTASDTSYKNDVGGGGGGGGGGGVCMFNYECAQLGGSVVGSCVDVFLYGACCRLPPGTKLSTIEHGGPTTAAAVTSADRPSYAQPLPPPPSSSSFQQPMADTILLHRNGSAVQNAYGPDDMSADLLANFTAAVMHANRWQPPSMSLDDMAHAAAHHQHNVQYTTSSTNNGYHQDRRPPFANVNKITSKVDYGDSWPSTTVKQQQQQPPSSSSPVSKSTHSVPNIRKTTPSANAAAFHSTTTTKQACGDEYDDGMVLIPTLTVANDPNVKTPVENNSIHHILSILNNHHTPSGTTSGDKHQEHDPMESSSSYHQYAQTSSPSSPALYTWNSIEGNSKTPGYGSSSTFPVTRPASTAGVHSSSYYTPAQHYDRPPVASNTNYYGSTPTAPTTSTHHLPGPHFHVLSTTTKPPAEPVAPTVIVLSSANDVKNPNKYTTTTSVYGTTPPSSYHHRPSSTPSSHVKPSQGIIVTGKPSVSAAYTTTSNHQQQQQQNLAFVPVSTTNTLADKYYNSASNDYAQHADGHASAKPSSSASKPAYRPPAATTSLPPTLSSTVHHDNNMFTTVITSVNHHQYNKYQPTTVSTYSTAKPVLNHDSTAVTVLSSAATPGGGYRPHVQQSAVDDVDYPLPAVTQPTQVFITASDVHHHHHHLQQYTAGGVASNDQAANAGIPFNSTDTFAFPPVRDPNVNMTAAAQQQDRPPDHTVVVAGDADDYDADADPNPQLTADDNLDDKVHLFVEKVVQSLQGNFEDLEKVLLSGDSSTSNVTISNDDAGPTGARPNKKPSTTTKKPPRPAAGAKPTKPPTAKPVSGTYRPTPIAPPSDAPYLELTSTARPTKVPTLLTPVQLFQPTTYTARPPTKQPVKVTGPTTTVLLDTFSVEQDHTTAEPDYRKVCGVRPLVRKNGRIVGGTGSTFGEWPWQVLVREATWLGLFTKNKCGGVLITQKHVITAAHCQPGFLANLVAVFGEYDISGEVESKRSISKNVKRVIVHRQYDAATFENDIALLELESPISYDLHIVPICMPDDDDDFTGRMASVTGWGRLKYGGGVPSILQEVQVPIIENQVCQDMFETAGHTKTILSSFLCAGYANGQRDSCEGDSGGPLMIEKDNGRWTLVGTVSHGIKCAAPYLPGVYMRTTYYKPWLQTITGVQ